MRKFGGFVALVVLVAAAAVVFSTTQLGQDSAARRYTTWHAYGGGPHSSQFTGLDQINKSNVSQLEVAWTYPVSGTIMFNPIVVDGVMYTLGSGNAVVALDAATGREIWTRPNQGGVGARGFNYWESADRSDRRILYLNAGHLTAINAVNGEVIASFGTEGRVDLREALQQSAREARNPLQTSNPGRIFEDTFIISLPAQGASYESTPGNVQAYDVRTGELRWVFHAIPHEGEFGADTWPEGHYRTGGGVHNWAELTVDEARGIAFIPFGSPRFDFFGGDRRGDNLFGNSIVALNARTGERLWHFQTIHHDLWDYDLPNAPKLLTIQQDGRSIDVVAQVSKQGLIFVFERETGRPVWPIEERPVPQSDVPGEFSSPTQPFPTRPPPFGRNTFTVDDINPFLPESEQASLRERFPHWRNEGLYTPPSFEGSVQMPGHNGGANWGSVGVDPIRGHLYVVSKNMPTLLRLTSEVTTAAGAMGGGAPSPIVTREQADRMREAAQAVIDRGEPIRYGSPYDFIQSPTYGMTAIGPPWSEITAYDLNTGEIKWRRPHGTVVPPADADMTIPEDAGSHMPRGGPLVTAGGLVFVATASDRTLRAYDRDTGEVVWSMDLPTGSEGVPASYEVDGRQFLVFPVAAGSGTFSVRFGPPAGRGAGADAQAGGRGGRGGGRAGGAPAGAPPAPTGAYMALALPAR
jgi:glucose dehydrogenase